MMLLVIRSACLWKKQESLAIINRTHWHVDSYKVGKWNYSADANKIDWKRFVHEAIELFEKLGKEYYVKKSLQEYI
jgi:hypothetical protein